jgi:hypothetical protein
MLTCGSQGSADNEGPRTVLFPVMVIAVGLSGERHRSIYDSDQSDSLANSHGSDTVPAVN